MDSKSYWMVCLAGLLHDIGMFIGGNDAPREFIAACRPAFSAHVNTELLYTLMCSCREAHPSPGESAPSGVLEEAAPLARIIAMADAFSSPGRSEKRQESRTRQLQSIFSRIELDGMAGDPRLTYDRQPFTAGAIFPQPTPQEPADAGVLSRRFISECRQYTAEADSPEALLRTCQLLIHRYCWCVPANPGDEIADVSLSDHLSTTSAIAACLTQYHDAHRLMSVSEIGSDDKPRFLLLAGDISGIQRYITGDGRQNPKGLAKRLRARSFIVSALSQLAASALVGECGLPDSCVLMSSGGNFQILLPNTADCRERVRMVREKIDAQLFDRFQGALQIHMRYVALRGTDLKEFGSAVVSVKARLSAAKRMPMAAALQIDGAWREDAFVLRSEAGNRDMGICSCCNREFADQIYDEERIGLRCRQETVLGGRLPSLSTMALVRDDGAFLSAGGVALSESVRAGVEISLGKQSGGAPRPLWPIATYIPSRDGQPLRFEEIAGRSSGAAYLAWLKADVDNLGAMFSLGFREDDGTRHDTVSRVATLSRMLDAFFSQWLPGFIERQYPDCYIVYSGGDDLLIVGPWDRTIHLAGEIREHFARFTGGHRAATLSAGIALCHPRLPVVRAFQMADEALEQSKQRILRGEDAPKDQLTVFGCTVKWSRWAGVLADAERLAAWRAENRIASADLYRLRSYARMYAQFNRGDVRGLRYAGMLAWELGRKVQDSRSADREFLEWSKRLFDIGIDAPIRHLQIACDYALLYNRRRNDHER